MIINKYFARESVMRVMRFSTLAPFRVFVFKVSLVV
jgi:hypothetical protein